MKRFLAVWILLAGLWMALPVQAQLHFGLKGGLNVSKVSFSKSVMDGDNRAGFFVGPMAEFTLPVLGLGIDAAALYSQSDVSVKLAGHQATTETLKSIEFPVNLKWSLGLGSTLGIYLAGGPQFGFNVGKGYFMNTFDMKTCYTSFNIGAGVKLLRHFQAGITYNFGLSKMAKFAPSRAGEEYKESDWGTLKRKTWQFSLAFLF